MNKNNTHSKILALPKYWYLAILVPNKSYMYMLIIRDDMKNSFVGEK